jgi:hypothetical protein
MAIARGGAFATMFFYLFTMTTGGWMRHLWVHMIACAALSACAQAEPPAASGQAPAAPMAAIEDAEPDVTRQVSEILGSVGQGTLAPERLTDNARAALPASAMQTMMAALRPCGALPALELLRRTTKGEDRQYVYRVLCGGKAQVAEIDFNKGARINRLSVRAEGAR